MIIRRLVLLLSALGLSVVTFAAPASAASTALTFTVRNQQGNVLSTVHPTAFHLVDANGHRQPEGQLITTTRSGALVLSVPGTLPPNFTRVGQSWGGATLRVQETTSTFVKVQLEKPFVSDVIDLAGKTRVTIRYAALTLSLCERLLPGAPVTCH
jgi:hypothetical protein